MKEETRIEVNVEKIMQEIRSKIAMDEDVANMPAFEEVPIRGASIATDLRASGGVAGESSLVESLAFINGNCIIPYYWSFGGGGIKVFLKRLVRRLAKCILLPIVEKQNMFNEQVVVCINNLNREVQELNSRLIKQTEESAQREQELLQIISDFAENHE